MPDYARPTTAEVEAMADRMIDMIGNHWDIDIVTLKDAMVAEYESVLDGMYQIPVYTAFRDDLYVSGPAPDEGTADTYATYIYDVVFGKEVV